jgi:hypothetical protein
MTATDPILSTLQQLSRLLSVEHARAEERARTTHERFNVFTTLLGAHDEVRLHTRFLHNLLNPAGTHDCGALFLNLFFQTLTEMPPLNEDDQPVEWTPVSPDAGWSVGKEVSVNEGQMDLLLETPGMGIAIENKIWAGEQADQLKRYASYLHRRHEEAGRLLYLTPDGKKASSHSGEHYLRISYREHILAWLEKCLQASYRFIPINQVLLQYRAVVRGITGQTSDQAIMNQLTDFMLQNPDLLRHRQVINQACDQVRGAFMDRLVKRLQDTPPAGFSTKWNPMAPQKSFGQQDPGILVIDLPAERSFPLHGAQICLLHLPRWAALTVGIGWLDKEPMQEQARLFFQQLNLRLDESCKVAGYHKAGPHNLRDGTQWPTGWHDLYQSIDDSCMARLLESQLEEVAAEVWRGIEEYIVLLEREILRHHVTDATLLNEHQAESQEQRNHSQQP